MSVKQCSSGMRAHGKHNGLVTPENDFNFTLYSGPTFPSLLLSDQIDKENI